ncbi:hypothetical protein PanWU01x14_019560, partial [Parasponia andersonii]
MTSSLVAIALNSGILDVVPFLCLDSTLVGVGYSKRYLDGFSILNCKSWSKDCFVGVDCGSLQSEPTPYSRDNKSSSGCHCSNS